MNFWEQFWPQFWGGIASGATLALFTGLITFLVRKHIWRSIERHLSMGPDVTKQSDQSNT